MKANSKIGWWVCKAALLNIIMATTVLAEGQICDYDINDEWPWLDNRICQETVAPASITPPLLFSDDSTPACSSASADPDGDGWGWENQQSCISPAGNSSNGYCQSSASDPDGDGWGWEFNRSCVVAENKNPDDSGGSSDPSTPECSNAIADPDGDGWGWENEQSCLISSGSGNSGDSGSTLQQCQSAASDPDGDGWGWESNRSCVIGDSTSVDEPGSDTPVCINNTDPDGDGWGWELDRSCIITADSNPKPGGDDYLKCTGANPDPDGDGWGLENGKPCFIAAAKDPTTDLVFEENFTAATAGKYGSKQLNDSWGTPAWHLGFDQGRVNVIYDSEEHGNALQVTFPAGEYGASGASAFLSDIQFGMDLPENYNELYLSYDLKFDDNFEFVLGGKLPGLCGHDSNRSPYSGCNTGGGFPTGYDGWSARGMWRVDGAMENYVYHASQSNYYGDDELWNVKATPGQWHTVQHRVVMNAIGQKNGIIEAWFDGKKVLSITNVEFRKLPTIGINQFYFSTFFGGNDSSWAPGSDQFITFDNFAVSTDPIIDAGAAQNDPALGASTPAISTGGSGGGSVSKAHLYALLLLLGVVSARRCALRTCSARRH